MKRKPMKQVPALFVSGIFWALFFPLSSFSQCFVASDQDTFLIPTDSLFVYLPFEWGFWDLSGNSFHPTANHLSRSLGVRGMAANFSSPNINKELTLPDSARLEPLQSYSISLWLLTGQTSQFSLLEQRSGSNDPNLANFAWYINAPGINPISHAHSFPMFLGHPNTPYLATMNTPVSQATDSTWHHYVFVKDVDALSPEFRLYEDGCLINRQRITNGAFNLNGSLSIGKDYLGNYPFEGLLDQFRIYKKTLTPAEVYALLSFDTPLEISETDTYCANGHLEVCIAYPQPHTTYQIVNEWGAVVQSAISNCSRDTICLSVQSYGGDSLFLRGQNGGCQRILRILSPDVPPQRHVIDTTICQGDTVFIRGMPYFQAGTYDFFDINNGCQDITTYNISFGKFTQVVTDTSICIGDTLFHDGIAMADSGTYTFLDSSSAGCPDRRVFVLSLTESLNVQVDTTICVGDSVVVDGNVLKQTGVYSFVDSSQLCRKNITYQLAVKPKVELTVDTTLCVGDSLILAGITVYAAGEYVVEQEPLEACKRTITYRVQERQCSLNVPLPPETFLPQNLFDLSTHLQSGTFSSYHISIFDFTGRLLASYDSFNPLTHESVDQLLRNQVPMVLRIRLEKGKQRWLIDRKLMVVK